MPRVRGRAGRLVVRFLRRRGQAPVGADRLDAIIQRLRVVQRVGVRHGLGNLEGSDQGDQLVDDRADPTVLRLGHGVRDHPRVGVEREQTLAEVEGVLRSAPQLPHQPVDGERGRPPVVKSLVRGEDRVPGEDGVLEPQPLAGLGERGERRREVTSGAGYRLPAAAKRREAQDGPCRSASCLDAFLHWCCTLRRRGGGQVPRRSRRTLRRLRPDLRER